MDVGPAAVVRITSGEDLALGRRPPLHDSTPRAHGRARLTTAEGAARAVHRLMAALVAHEASDDILLLVQQSAEALVAELEAGPARSRAASFHERSARQHDDDHIADGDPVDLFPLSPVSGKAHPASLGVSIRRDRDAAVGTLCFDVAAEAAPGRAHGGLIAACVDEMFAAALVIARTFAYTGELTVRYRRPCPIDVPMEFRAWIAERDGRKLQLRCVGTARGVAVVEARGIAIVADQHDS